MIFFLISFSPKISKIYARNTLSGDPIEGEPREMPLSLPHHCPYCFLTHNDLYDIILYECLKIASLFFLSTVAFHLFLMMAYA